MALTDTAIRKIKPSDKPFKMTDHSGLYLLIKPNGSKFWYMKYRIDDKEKKLAFGPYLPRDLAVAGSSPARSGTQ